DLAAISEVLCPLPDIERQSRLALARIAAVQLHDAVLEYESAQRPRERLGLEHLEIQPEIPEFVRHCAGQPSRLAADPAEDGRRTGLVVDLHEELTPAVLDELGSSRPRCDFHA